MAVTTTWTDPSTSGTLDRAVEDILDETRWDGVLSNIKHLAGANGTNCATLTKSADQGITNVTVTALTWDQEAVDTAGLHSVASNTSRITPLEAGVYVVVANITWATGGAGTRQQQIRLNGATVTTIAGHVFNTSVNAGGTVADILRFNGSTDYVEVYVYQDSGGTTSVLNSTSCFAAFRIGV